MAFGFATLSWACARSAHTHAFKKFDGCNRIC